MSNKRFRVGDTVVVTLDRKCTYLHGLIGEVTRRTLDGVYVSFSDEELSKAEKPENVKACKSVFFHDPEDKLDIL